ncbi:hypothetical protein ACVIW2_002330 [Bradyrhizobium huanghuaihaiense]|uniref:Uncharacterized protein n=1 Tax=Bradyrhizobium huanghuaihaiense TaxID=990078 RepID=A0A562RV09_9BRAD|nr:hypothetical protein IQ16_02861 [Bradyrhizobium huanghuaihaiense]
MDLTVSICVRDLRSISDGQPRKEVYPNNGLSTTSATDHNDHDGRSAFLIKVEAGRFRLMK